jgi:predicted kinase
MASILSSNPASDRFVEHEITRDLAENLRAPPQSRPVIILIGGYQGSGKSTLISKVTHTFDANVISNDRIRQQLFDRGYHPDTTPEFSNYVNSIFINLFQTALSQNTHIIIDANAHAKRLEAIYKLLQECSSEHSVVKILLTASPETLKDRVRTRSPTPGAYQGTESDLEASLRVYSINPEDYDLVIDTELTPEKEAAAKMIDFLEHFGRVGQLD